MNARGRKPCVWPRVVDQTHVSAEAKPNSTEPRQQSRAAFLSMPQAFSAPSHLHSHLLLHNCLTRQAVELPLFRSLWLSSHWLTQSSFFPFCSRSHREVFQEWSKRGDYPAGHQPDGAVSFSVHVDARTPTWMYSRPRPLRQVHDVLMSTSFHCVYALSSAHVALNTFSAFL